ncbi:MAG TPA: Nif3-like dinuclear metal center hexameric protein [Fimbriimonadales bacterium]|nr:Nif3-like dinuclear metal center hexameric protein [Fimbriimonadales bacterium]
MPTVAELLHALDSIAPPHLALPNDAIGLQVGSEKDKVERCLVALDPSLDAIEYAVSKKFDALITHHAPIYIPLANVAGDSPNVRVVREAIRHNIALLCAHTNWDAAPGGTNDTLASCFHLKNVRPFGKDIPTKAYKLFTFLPEESLDKLLDALAEIGCGEIGAYRRCAFYHPGSGTFEPQPGAQPFIGSLGGREVVPEVRVEILVPGHLKEEAIKTLLSVHPYEEPAYDLYEVANVERKSLPRMGELTQACSLAEFCARVENTLETKTKLYGDLTKSVRTIGIVGGAGGSYWNSAIEAGCEVLLTGEVKHHEALYAQAGGLSVIEAGHYATEQPAMRSLCKRLRETLPEVNFELFEPKMGTAGRPYYL